MKKRILCAMTCLLMLIALLPALAMPAAADADNKAVADCRNGVVRLFGIGDDGTTWVGSAFGVGEVGQPTDIFVTNRHCILGNDIYGRETEARRIYLVLDGNSLSYEFTAYVNANNQIVEEYYSIDADTERMIPCDVIYYSEEYDVAILKAIRKVEGRVALELAESANDAVPSDNVYTLGYPGVSDEVADLSDWEYTGAYTYTDYGKADIYTCSFTRSSYIEDMTITTGTVSRLTTLTSANNTKVIQHDAQVHGGNSGGPLVNSKGQVIGINTYSTSEASLNYAVYIDYARNALKELGLLPDPAPAPTTPASTTPSSSVAPTTPVDPDPVIEDYVYLIILAVVVVAAGVIIALILVRSKRQAAAQQQAAAQAAAQAAQAAQAQAAHASARSPYIRSMAPQHGGMRMAVSGRSLLVGRSKTDCTLCYADNTPGVSGRHCSVHWDGTNFVVTDLGSSYGTFLQNGQKLTPGTPYNLQPGTSLWLGDKQNVLRLELE